MTFQKDFARVHKIERAICHRFGFENVNMPTFDGIKIGRGSNFKTLEIKSHMQKTSSGYKIELIDPMTKNNNPPGKGSDFVAFTRKLESHLIVSLWSSEMFRMRVLSNTARALNNQSGWSLMLAGDRGDCLCMKVAHEIIEDSRHADVVEMRPISWYMEQIKDSK
jgi:hypothetical protein